MFNGPINYLLKLPDFYDYLILIFLMADHREQKSKDSRQKGNGTFRWKISEVHLFIRLT